MSRNGLFDLSGKTAAIIGGGSGIGKAVAIGAAALGAYAIDIGSGVDSIPGVKSPGKIRALFDALRPASRQELRQCA